jgi:hypothetical protein
MGQLVQPLPDEPLLGLQPVQLEGPLVGGTRVGRLVPTPILADLAGGPRPRAPDQIWCSQSKCLLCPVNDAVNDLPCSTCAYLNGGPIQPALPLRHDAAFWPPPDYGSGGWELTWPSDFAEGA